MIVLIPILVAVAGALVWALVQSAPLKEMGRIAFFVGLFWAVAPYSGRAISILGQ